MGEGESDGLVVTSEHEARGVGDVSIACDPGDLTLQPAEDVQFEHLHGDPPMKPKACLEGESFALTLDALAQRDGNLLLKISRDASLQRRLDLDFSFLQLHSSPTFLCVGYPMHSGLSGMAVMPSAISVYHESWM